MGRQLVDRLRQDGFDVVTINRGNVYWDCERYDGNLIADRKDVKTYSETISAFVLKKKLTGVVDFCGYRKKDIHSLPDSLFTAPYIFISTDSVYECIDMGRITRDFISESDSELVDKRFKKRDSYGYNKWRCENFLAQRTKHLYILRLCDVLGEFDDTFRFSKLGSSGVDSPNKLGFVYSGDVTRFIQKLLIDPFISGKTMNLVMDEQISGKEFLDLVEKFGGRIREKKSFPYPSVEFRTKIVSGDKARENGFVATSWETVIERVVDWNRKATDIFPTQMKALDARKSQLE